MYFSKYKLTFASDDDGTFWPGVIEVPNESEVHYEEENKNNFIKKKNFTRFAKSRLTTTKNGKIEVEILKGQESFRIKSFVKSNTWSLLPSGKSKFKKGDVVDCFFPNHPNQSLIW